MRRALLALALLALAAAPVRADPPETEHFWPYMSFSFTSAGMATAAISVSTYAAGLPSAHPLGEWSLQVVAIGTGFIDWTVDLELSLDGSAWTSVLRHRQGKQISGSMVWDVHHPARQARLKLTTLTGSGAVITATGYGEPRSR